MQDDALKHFFEDMAFISPCDGFLQLLGQSNPILRVLEIGAGTGGLTSIALNSDITQWPTLLKVHIQTYREAF